MRVVCVDNEPGFLKLYEDWENLRQHSTASSIFLSHDWIRCCWEELKSSHALRVFLVLSGERPILIAPCMLSRVADKGLPVTSLTFIEHPETQVADLLISEDIDGGRALNTLLHHLLTKKAVGWNLLLLNKIPGESKTVRYLESASDGAASFGKPEPAYESPMVSLRKTWSEYLAGQSPRFRKTLRNIVNRMQKLGRLSVRKYEGERSGEGIKELFSVSDASWKVADGVAITSSEKRMRFFKQLSESPTTAAGLRIIILELNDAPIASETQIVDGTIVYALRSDYDEGYADSSPGTFLQMEILKDLFAGPYMEYSFGVGLNPYKARWTDERRRLMAFRLYNDTFYARLLHAVHRFEPRLSQVPGVRLLNDLFGLRTTDYTNR